MRLINNILFCGILLSTAGCSNTTNKQANNVDNITDITEEEVTTEPIEEETEAEPNFVLDPKHIFFYTTAIIDEDGSLSCYDTDDGPYCGIFRYYIADTENWTGRDDFTYVCHIVHQLSPGDVLPNSDPTPFLEAGDWYGWTMDASETYYGKSDSCSDIPNNHPTKILVGQFATQNYSFGYGPATEAHLEGFKEYVEEQVAAGNDVPAWDTYWAPNIISNSIIAGGTTVVTKPNYGFAFLLDSDGIPVSTDNTLAFIEMQNATGLVHGYYRSKTWWGYSIDDYITGE